MERAAAEDDPRRKALVTAVRDHMEYEIKGELDPLMDTLTSNPIYHFWGQAEPSVIEGRDAVRAFYGGMFATGGQQFEVVVDKVVVSDNHVITEGQVKQVHKGASLTAMGIGEVDGEPAFTLRSRVPDYSKLRRNHEIIGWDMAPDDEHGPGR